MGKLLRKNWILNKKNVVIGIVASIFFGLIAYDGYKYYAVALLMCPSLLFSFIVGKMCYIEDSHATKDFMISLPIAKRDIVFEKNILSHLCIFVGMIIAHLMFLIINQVISSITSNFDINTVVIISLFLIIYNMIFIWLNYKFDYSKTQFTSYIILVLMFVLFKFGNTSISAASININIIVLITALIFTSAMSFLLLRKV